jgi:hypothetical protein
MRRTEMRYQARTTGKLARERRGRWLPFVLSAAGVLVLGGLLLAFWGSGLGRRQAAVEVAGSPRLMVDQQKVDIGQVPLGQQVQVKFELANVGDQTLRFTEAPYVEVKEGC